MQKSLTRLNDDLGKHEEADTDNESAKPRRGREAENDIEEEKMSEQ